MIVGMIVIVLLAIMLFAYVKNRQENRKTERRERLLQKQEELLESLRKEKEE